MKRSGCASYSRSVVAAATASITETTTTFVTTSGSSKAPVACSVATESSGFSPKMMAFPYGCAGVSR